tara:strand:+ start:2224 stop:2901 length:678 start_codon:yes stop_codon:yes gene_type:complete
MKLCNKKIIIAVSLTIIALTACNGSDDLDKDINLAEKNRSSMIKFVNATDEMSNFYASPNAITESIYNSKYELASILKGETSELLSYQWNEKLSRTEMAVTDSNTETKKATVMHELEHNKAYFAVAWLDEDNLSLSIVDAQISPQNNVYNIRFFSALDKSIFLGNNSSALTTVKKGNISNDISVENCTEIELINNIQSNFCQVANIGESYLIVIDANNDIVIAQE